MGVWLLGGNLNGSSMYLASCGELNSALKFGGISDDTEEYDGSSWTQSNDLLTSRSYLGGCGSLLAGLSMAGYTTTGVNDTEEYDGTSWSASNDMNRNNYAIGAAGTQLAALEFGGVSSGSGAEEYDGSCWTVSNDLNTAASYPSGAGLQSAALCIGGNSPPSNKTQEYDGVCWSQVNTLLEARFRAAGCGTVSDALVYGGTNSTPATTDTTEQYDGSCWSADSSMLTGRYNLGGCGSISGALNIGGITSLATVITEEYREDSSSSQSSSTSSSESSSSESSSSPSSSTEALTTSSSSSSSTEAQTTSSSSTSSSSSTEALDTSSSSLFCGDNIYVCRSNTVYFGGLLVMSTLLDANAMSRLHKIFFRGLQQLESQSSTSDLTTETQTTSESSLSTTSQGITSASSSLGSSSSETTSWGTSSSEFSSLGYSAATTSSSSSSSSSSQTSEALTTSSTEEQTTSSSEDLTTSSSEALTTSSSSQTEESTSSSSSSTAAGETSSSSLSSSTEESSSQTSYGTTEESETSTETSHTTSTSSSEEYSSSLSTWSSLSSGETSLSSSSSSTEAGTTSSSESSSSSSVELESSDIFSITSDTDTQALFGPPRDKRYEILGDVYRFMALKDGYMMPLVKGDIPNFGADLLDPATPDSDKPISSNLLPRLYRYLRGVVDSYSDLPTLNIYLARGMMPEDSMYLVRHTKTINSHSYSKGIYKATWGYVGGEWFLYWKYDVDAFAQLADEINTSKADDTTDTIENYMAYLKDILDNQTTSTYFQTMISNIDAAADAAETIVDSSIASFLSYYSDMQSVHTRLQEFKTEQDAAIEVIEDSSTWRYQTQIALHITPTAAGFQIMKLPFKFNVDSIQCIGSSDVSGTVTVTPYYTSSSNLINRTKLRVNRFTVTGDNPSTFISAGLVSSIPKDSYISAESTGTVPESLVVMLNGSWEI